MPVVGFVGCVVSLVLVGVLVFRYLPLYGVSNVWRLDGLAQHFPALYHYNEVVRAFLADPSRGIELWSWELGLGADNIGSLSYYIGDPFALASLAFPMGRLEYAYEWLFFARLMCAGLAAYAYLRTIRAAPLGAIAGSLMYVFTTFTMFSALRHPYFANPLVFLPLILIGMERVLAGKRPYALVVAVSLAAVSSFYFFYQLTIVSVVYAVARYFEVAPKGKRLLGLVPSALWVGGLYAIGTALGAVLLVPSVRAFFESSRAGVSQQFGLLFDIDIYRSYVAAFASSLLGANSVFAGFSVLGFMVLPVIFVRRRRYSALKLMLVLFPVFLTFPFFGTMFNGWAFPSYRFVFMWGLFLSAAVALVLSDRRALNLREVVVMQIGLVVFSTVAVGALGILDAKIIMPLAVGALIWVVFAIEGLLVSLRPRAGEARGGVRIGEYGDRRSMVLRCLVVGLLVFNIVSNGAFSFDTGFSDRLADYVPLGETLPAYQTGAGAEAGELPGGGFFRVDKQDTVFGSSLKTTASNDSLVQGYNGITYYYSVLDAGVFEYLAGLDDRSMRVSFDYNGFDDRAVLDTLGGVRYYLTGERGAQYVPYGFDAITQDSTTSVFANRHALPLGYVYHSAIASETYAGLRPLEKQQALLQGVVLGDGDAKNLPRIKPELSVVDVPYSATARGSALFDAGANRIITSEQFGQIDLHFQPVPDTELYVDLRGISYQLAATTLDATGASRAESVIAAIAEPPDPALIKRVDPLHIAFGTHGAAKVERIEDPRYEYSWGDTSMLVNLGYSRNGTDSAYVRVVEPAVVDFGELHVYAIPMNRFAEQVGRLSSEGMRDVSVGTNTVSGTVTAQGDGLLFLSIPYSEGWTATVDGRPATILPANVGFSGIPLRSGQHVVELRYRTPGLAQGLELTRLGGLALGLVVLGFEGWRLARWVRTRRTASAMGGRS